MNMRNLRKMYEKSVKVCPKDTKTRTRSKKVPREPTQFYLCISEERKKLPQRYRSASQLLHSRLVHQVVKYCALHLCSVMQTHSIHKWV